MNWEFMLGFGLGFGSCLGLAFLHTCYEWAARRQMQRRVDQLWEHLACGQGYLGCDAGRNCKWSHK
jgi:hypothetical protein